MDPFGERTPQKMQFWWFSFTKIFNGGSERVRVPPLVFFSLIQSLKSSNKKSQRENGVLVFGTPNLTVIFLIFRQFVGWPSPVQNTEGAWLALLMGVYAVWILFKLDLYMKREQRCRWQWSEGSLNATATHSCGGIRLDANLHILIFRDFPCDSALFLGFGHIMTPGGGNWEGESTF